METVVVGVDRSVDSFGAVAWGVRQARTTGAALVLAHAYDVPDVPLGVDEGYLSHDPTELRQHALAYLMTLASELRAPATTAFQVERDRHALCPVVVVPAPVPVREPVLQPQAASSA